MIISCPLLLYRKQIIKYIQCPHSISYGIDNNSIFLAGGITGCPDWQSEMVSLLNETSLTLVNPRRTVFTEDIGKKQIIWEYNHLQAVDSILFYFPKETVCPITLFEYGKWFNRGKQIFVGCHPSYSRKFDLLVQTELERPDIEIVFSLTELAEQIKQWQKLKY